MKISPLQIGDLKATIPIIQGGMGVGVSLSNLASAVANEGGIGIISGVQIGFREPDFETNTKEANIRALKKEMKKAKELSPIGIIGVNLMVAINNYDEMVKAAVESGADIIISGAGLPTSLPKFVKGTNTKIAPIVSSGKAAKVICKLWEGRFSYLPDFIVVEGPEAGGHLGFKMNDLQEDKKINLESIVKDVLSVIKIFEEKHNKRIPIIAAGGIYTGKDIAKFIKLGASAVQIGTRFICTEECDADKKYKEAFIKCNENNIKIIKSPVGLPGRAINNEFVQRVSKEKEEVNKCFNCLKKCDPSSTLYCISKALINAANGNTKDGLIFTGRNGYKMEKIITVKQLIDELVEEVRNYE
ncbi:NAD(P)H-dependent flavin oxidoreductase [Clostridium rectalis]|uniref:NAD(P)H-dependent flavin oxidoreductase n=1 Tax=Clostridium rectalis TaxID=2040295 RepID=UPI000F62DF03|nr:nitronate monooxygenase family protein [Clostridium rectalis]